MLRVASSGKLSSKRLHRRVEPVAVAQLQRQAFRQVAGENAGRIELLEPGQNRLDPRRARSRAEPRPRRARRADSRLRRAGRAGERDHPVGLARQIGADLLDQMLAQGARPSRGLLEAGAVLAAQRAVAAAPGLRLTAEIDRRRRPRRRDAACQCSAASGAKSSCRRLGQRRRARFLRRRPGAAAGDAVLGASRSRRSSSGFCWISASTKSVSSRFESCSILIACCSCGVITNACDWRSSSRWEKPILFTSRSARSGL